MSVKETEILNKSDLKYMLIDSLRLYTDNVSYIDGNNPYRFSINKKEFYILIKNIHESGEGRKNQDECRIQVSKTRNFNPALSSKNDIIVLGYFADEKVFTAWDPYKMRSRFNEKQTVSIYSRFSIQRSASINKISLYIDNNEQNIISFKPEYLGLYLDNIDLIHYLDEQALLELVNKSDELNLLGENGEIEINSNKFNVSHSREPTYRNPKFREMVYNAYNYRCAICGIQLELIEAAHIIPFSHPQGNDEVSNGICLCALHHTAYDKSLIYFDKEYKIHLNEEKVAYLEKVGLDSGIRKFENLQFDELKVPNNHYFVPNKNNIVIANKIRGIT
jgi:putative restriction endonuclease